MSVLRHPAACEVCSGKLSGAAEIELEREGESYYINFRQTAPLNWGICPRCKKVACANHCFDKKGNYCVTCPSFDEAGSCPECKRALVGAVEVIETETFGIPTILLEETPDRNWIQCDSCSLVICKHCCKNPKSGYCNTCLSRIKNDESKQTCPVVTEVERYRFAAANGSQAAKTNTQTNIQTNQGGEIR